MGKIIRKKGAVDDIFDDVRTTHVNAVARGGIWKAVAEERLASVMAAIEQTETELAQAEAQAIPIFAALEAENLKADRLLGKVSDDIWNAVGRPASDPYYGILFPGGFAHYADGDVTAQPARMTVLVELLRKGMHPTLPADVALASADAIEAAANELRVRVDAASVPRAKLATLGRMRDSVARTAQTVLSGLKRIYRGYGFTEAEVHTVIPDRPRATPKKAAAPSEPTSTP
ncbi:hypothetical protein [Polyangium aurulentum]|uniref:hypothetical protein n=1 Tax=Polyangium aurulentum TaxID=2567896 RepID=UPI0010AE97C9|nr:hypothetical protein [Polyangium aurulentum]UQA56779.1 hypothetical protein E8A73_036580 [Polyangium aurulentum]